MFLVSIYPLFFFFLLIRELKVKTGLLYKGLLLMYFLAGIAACIIFDTNQKVEGSYVSLLPVIFHCICLFLIISPFKKFEKFKNIDIQPIPSKLLGGMTFFFIFCGLYGILELAPQVSLASIMTDTQELRRLYDDEKGQDSYFSFFGCKYWTISLVLAFYYMKTQSKRWVIILLLIISSFCYICDGLRFAGRECILKYSFVIVVLFYFFKNNIPSYYKKLVKTLFIVGGVMGISLLAVITYMRFDISQVSEESDTTASVFSYFGQGLVNFSSIFKLFPDGLTHGGHTFPTFFGPEPSNLNTKGIAWNTFSTTIGSWIKDMGITGAVFMTFAYNALLRIIGSIKCNIFTIFYVAWAYEFFFSTPFFYNDVWNGSRLISLFVIIMLDWYVRIKK